MEDAQRNDVWAAGDRYEPYVGRWSRRVASVFVDGLGVPEGSRWIDIGCGTGALTQTVVERAAPSSVIGLDPSDGFLAHARARLAAANVQFDVADAQSLPLPSASVDAAVSGLVLNFVPRPERALAEMARVVRPGGVVAAYVWDYAEGMQLMRHFWDAAAALDPAALALDEGRRFPLCRPGPLRELFEQAGLVGCAVWPIDVPTVFRDFDDFWSPFLGGQGPAPGYAMALDEPRRVALAQRLRERLPVGADGSIVLAARAWAVRGTVAPRGGGGPMP
jgi:SAM-dependent methyltransferase